jgi:hypothetical protein
MTISDALLARLETAIVETRIAADCVAVYGTHAASARVVNGLAMTNAERLVDAIARLREIGDEIAATLLDDILANANTERLVPRRVADDGVAVSHETRMTTIVRPVARCRQCGGTLDEIADRCTARLGRFNEMPCLKRMQEVAGQ